MFWGPETHGIVRVKGLNRHRVCAGSTQVQDINKASRIGCFEHRRHEKITALLILLEHDRANRGVMENLLAAVERAARWSRGGMC